MPGNTIIINGSEDLEWYIGDSKMELLIAILNEIGSKSNDQSVGSIPKERDEETKKE